MTGPRDTRAWVGFFQGSVLVLICILMFSAIPCPVSADRGDDLTIGEAFFMSGNLAEASRHLEAAAGSKVPNEAQRAFYLLARISLLRGDFRQAKEFFERSADVAENGTAGRWMALAGIGDTLYASGRYEEAIRRYREALRATSQDGQGAVIELKIALCEHSLGEDTKALDDLGSALSRIPILSGWVGREEAFYHSMVMAGIEPAKAVVSRIYIKVGPIKGDFRVDEVVGPDIPAREIRVKGESYLEFGPLTDPVEAMILSEKIRSRYSIAAEIVTR